VLQIPNLKTTAPADQSNFTFQSYFSTKVFRQNQPALSICAGVLCPGMQLAQEHAPIMCRNALAVFRSRTHSRKLRWQHNEQKLLGRLWQQNEFFRPFAPPTGGNGDAIFFVHGMAELASVEAFGLGICVHCSSGGAFHFTPPDTTSIHFGGSESTKFFTFVCASLPQS
jgi:hypothetical protein